MSEKTAVLAVNLEEFVDVNEGFFEMWFPETGATIWFAPDVEIRPGLAFVRIRGAKEAREMPLRQALMPDSDRMVLMSEVDFDEFAEAIIGGKITSEAVTPQ